MKKLPLILIGFFALLVILFVVVYFLWPGGTKVEIPNQEINEGEQLVLDLSRFFSKDVEAYTFAIVSGVGVIRRDQYVLNADYGDAGDYVVVIRGRDSEGKTTDTELSISVKHVNTPPSIDIDDQIVYLGERLELDLLAFVTDPEGDPVSMRKDEGPGEIVDARFFSFVPVASDIGEHFVTLTAEDNRGASTQGRFSVAVRAPDPAELVIADREITTSQKLVIDLVESLVDMQVAPNAFEIEEGPGRIDEYGVYTIDARSLEEGEYRVSIRAIWEYGVESTSEFSITATRPPSPRVSIPVFVVNEREEFSEYLGQYVENLELIGDTTFSILSGPGSVEDGNRFVLTSNDARTGIYRLAFKVEAEDSSEEVETVIRIIPSGSQAPETLVVGKTGEETFETIQMALDAARAGDTILITPGEYIENIQILKAVDVRGQSRDEVIIRPEDPDRVAVIIRANRFQLSGITVESPYRGIQLSSASGIISDTSVIAGRPGVAFIGGGGELLVRNVLLSSYGETDSEREINSQLVGLHAYGTGLVVVEDSTFERCGTGILVGNSIEFSIVGNTFRNNQIAVSLTSSSTGLFRNNQVVGNYENGLLLNTTGEVTISENSFYSNKLHGLDLYLRQCTVCRCGGTVFRGTVLGSGNVFDEPEGICPIDHSWPEGFYTVDETLAERLGQN